MTPEPFARLKALACHKVLYSPRPMRSFGQLVERGLATVDDDVLMDTGRIYYRITNRGEALADMLRKQEQQR